MKMKCNRMLDIIRGWWFQVALHLSLTGVWEPLEERIIVFVVFSSLILLTSVAYIYMPGHLLMLFQFFRHVIDEITNSK